MPKELRKIKHPSKRLNVDSFLTHVLPQTALSKPKFNIVHEKQQQ